MSVMGPVLFKAPLQMLCTVLPPVLLMRKLRFRELGKLVQDRSAIKWWSWDLNLGLLI